MRGTSLFRCASLSRMRFIPALAGNMPPLPDACSSSSVHPRACGEHHSPIRRTPQNIGSSPRLRGTYILSLSFLNSLRFIPALAGNMKGTAYCLQTHPVHPRACGEHYCIGASASIFAGSSPRLRGTFGAVCLDLLQPRFIPALAGNMLAWGQFRSCQPVHPRACGEHLQQWHGGR